MRRERRKRTAKKYRGYTLVEVQGSLVWKEPGEKHREAGEEVLDRVLSRFGWSRTPEGQFEHLGTEEKEKNRQGF